MLQIGKREWHVQIRYAQWCHSVQNLQVDMQRLAAGHQQADARTRLQQRHQLWRRGENLLHVVEHQQRLARRQVVMQSFSDGHLAHVLDLVVACDLAHHEVGIDEGRQINEPCAIGKARSDLLRDGDGQSGLASAARASQRQ